MDSTYNLAAEPQGEDDLAEVREIGQKNFNTARHGGFLIHHAMSLLIAAALLLVAPAQSQTKGASEYIGKLFIQRQFVSGSHPVYDAEGNPLSGTAGPWTTCAEIVVREIHESGESLFIEGSRMLLLYDRQNRQFRDIFDVLNSPSEAQRLFTSLPKDEQLEELRKEQAVTIEIRRAGIWDADAIAAAMHKVFLSQGEHLSDFATPAWKNFLCKSEKAADATSQCAFTGQHRTSIPFRVGGGVSAPRARYTPDPQYAEQARRARYQGQTVLWLVVDRDGNANEVSIALPVGLGLDEKAVAAVSQWKFDPAIKDREPVNVQINVEVNFRLY